MICPACGREVADGAALCPGCGASLRKDAEPGAPRRRDGEGLAPCPVCGDLGVPGAACEVCSQGEYGAPAQPAAPPSDGNAHVPRRLAADYEFVRHLGEGAQARVSLLRDRGGGGQVVLKRYHRLEAALDAAAAAKLRGAGLSEDESAEMGRHVLRVLDHNGSYGDNWELQEYCERGTLGDLLAAAPGGRLALERLKDVIGELGQALAFIHSLDIIHRDLKPSNVLVRTAEPLDLVLADFGTAKEQQLSHGRTSNVQGTYAYLPPEAYYGATGRALDWWALGMIAFEVCTGRHILSRGDGRLPSDMEIMHAVGEGSYRARLEEIDDERVRSLVEGLLLRDPESRWGGAQVLSWLDGHDPPVVRDAAPEQRGFATNWAFFVEGVAEPVATPEDLNRLLKGHWEHADALFVQMPDEFAAWLESDGAYAEIAKAARSR
ncbi:MAG: protein kinase, partial [Coriobacteriales bacterium]|nr:protein kinase [Coriobacteriales bacterium]